MRREAIRKRVDFLFRGARIAEETGTVPCVENLFHTPGFVIQSYAELSELVEAVKSPAVQITLDNGHADRADGLGQALDAFAPTSGTSTCTTVTGVETITK